MFLRFQNAGYVINAATKWLKKARLTIQMDKQGNEPGTVLDG